jgi:hypothetical protein
MVSMDEDRAAQRLSDAALAAVAAALTPGERAEVLRAAEGWDLVPSTEGVDIADLLDYTTDHDMFLDRTEPFFARHMPDLLDGRYGTIYAMHALILLGQPLTIGAVLALLQRAGFIKPKYPQARASVVLEDGAEANSLLVCARAEASLRASGVAEVLITRFRAERKWPLSPWSMLARSITLVTEFERIDSAPYDPVHDLAVVLTGDVGATGNVRQPSTAYAQALANLRAHVGVSCAEEAEAHLRGLLSRIDWRSQV